jgi:hypothetical protein
MKDNTSKHTGWDTSQPNPSYANTNKEEKKW